MKSLRRKENVKNLDKKVNYLNEKMFNALMWLLLIMMIFMSMSYLLGMKW